jgi:hypothetical protein
MRRNLHIGFRIGFQMGLVGASALILAACGGGDAGHGSSATAKESAITSSAKPKPVVSPSLLDVGTYPTKPRPPLGVSGSPSVGAVADAEHLADFVIGPWEVDDKLIDTYLSSFYLIGTPDVLAELGPQSVAAAAGEHGLVNGFASARQDHDKTAMVNAVMRFPDPATASAAATAMGDASAKQAIMGATPTVVPIPGHPEAVAATYPFTPHGSNQVKATVRSFAAHGPYVFMQFVQSGDGVDRATALVAKAIDAQAPVIDQFTPAADLAAVPLDPTGLLVKTLPTASGQNAKNGVYAARGAEHFQSDPPASATLFKDTGTTEVAIGATNVYQTKDEGSALMVTNAFDKEVSGDGPKPADAVAALPDSHCYQLPKAFYCVVPAGRYAIEAVGPTLDDTHHQLSAQYVLLTAS